jgi:hypothetical protein
MAMPSSPTEDQAGRHRQPKRQVVIGVDVDDRVCAQHVELAVREIDDAHDAEDEHQSDRDQRHEARGVGGIDAGLEQQLGHGLRMRSRRARQLSLAAPTLDWTGARARPGVRHRAPGSPERVQAQLRW